MELTSWDALDIPIANKPSIYLNRSKRLRFYQRLVPNAKK
jgi:hypothetical protein